MKNFKLKKIFEKKNNLRYIISNPYKELPTYTILKYLKERNFFIINKIEKITEEDTRLHIQLKKAYINIIISKDYLITLELLINNKKTLKTRKIEDVLIFLTENLK